MGSNVPPITPTRRTTGSAVLASATEGDDGRQQHEEQAEGDPAHEVGAHDGVAVLRLGGEDDQGVQHGAILSPTVRPAQRTCPSPTTTYLLEVISGSPIGPRACSFWVEMPISAPNPNSPPSTNRLDAFTSTAAASTSAVNRRAALAESVTIVSLCPVL